MVKKLIGKISNIDNLSDDVRNFKISLPEELEFKAGQFINLSFREKDELFRRPLSIASSPKNQTEIDLCIKLVTKGHLTPKLWKKQIGDEIEIMGPLGLFTMEKSKKDKVVFIGTGTGVGPLKSMLLDSLENGTEKEFTLIFGVRFEGTHSYNQEFEELEKLHSNFKYIKVVSRPNENWLGRIGHVQHNLDIVDPLNSEAYICGLPEMVEAVKEKLLEMGIAEENIKTEKY